MDKLFIQHIGEVLTARWKTPVEVNSTRPVGGGDINETAIIESSHGPCFIKLNKAGYLSMFEQEYNGLRLLGDAGVLKVPAPLQYGNYQQHAYLLMEYLPKGNSVPDSNKWLGEGLAAIHRCTSQYFGLAEDNYIGTLVQQNGWKHSWAVFYAENRIMPLVRHLVDLKRFGSREQQLAEALAASLGDVFPEEPPALLHGDLWAGNYMFTGNGEPVIYDPAIYYGHREMDLAMTLLFGGFDAAFYRHYQEVFPLAPGWKERVALCQLYPVLVHAILFGGHYVSQASDILKKYS